MFRLIFILLAIAGITAGILGPVYGQLTLFQISTIPDLLYPQIYTWVAYAFLGLAGLCLVASLLRRYIALFVFSLAGILMWLTSLYFYTDFQNFVLKQKDLLSTLMVKSWHLEWGAFTVITGFSILLLVAVLSRRTA